MVFSEKLALLMNLLKISNRQLAGMINVDPSLISKWRTGKRLPRKESVHLENLSAAIASLAQAEFKMPLAEILHISLKDASNVELLSAALRRWLNPSAEQASIPAEAIYRKIATFSMKPSSVNKVVEKVENGIEISVEVFLGYEGKKKGLLKLIAHMQQEKKARELFVYSDEDFDWLASDGTFALEVRNYLLDLISNGWKIKVIHTLSRKMEEMFAAFDFWLPIYATGSVEPYYNPHYAEYYFKRTILLIPDKLAFTCFTHGRMSREAPNYMVTDTLLLNLLKQEWEHLLSECRLLFKIAKPGSELLELLMSFDSIEARTYALSYPLPFETMTRSSVEQLVESVGNSEIREKLKRIWQLRRKLLDKSTEYHLITKLPSLEEVLSNRVPIGLPEAGKRIFYTPEQFRSHLQSTLHFLKRNENFRIYLMDKLPFADLRLILKDEQGITVTRMEEPFVFFLSLPNIRI